MKCRICEIEENQKIRASTVFGGEEKHNFWECDTIIVEIEKTNRRI